MITVVVKGKVSHSAPQILGERHTSATHGRELIALT
jgi:hypothetical protein